MLDADKQSHCNGCEKHGDICRFFPSLWDDNVLEYTYDQTIAGCPEEQAKNSEGECSRECFRCMELGWCVRGKHVSTAQIDHPRFARCQQCTCEGHVISEIAKTKKPWRQCRCEVRNDEFNFYESRIPYVVFERVSSSAKRENANCITRSWNITKNSRASRSNAKPIVSLAHRI